MKFFLLINVKMPTAVGILTFMSRKNRILGSTQLSMKVFLLINIKMQTVVGILTFMSGENRILGLSEPNISQIS